MSDKDYLAYLRTRSTDPTLSAYDRNVALSMLEMAERKMAGERGEVVEPKKRKRLGYAIGRATR